jgi:Fe-S cluster assembly protein SufD
LKDYSEFVKQAMENYEKLPQETSEIYKRYFINIPFDLKSFSANPETSDEKNTASKIKVDLSALNLKFDVLMEGNTARSESEFVKIIQKGKNPSDFENRMYKSGDDKYVAYTQACSDNDIVIDVPDNKNVEINMLVMNSSKPVNSNIFIKIGDNCKVNLFEYYCSSSEKLSSLSVIQEIAIGKGSEVEINALHNENSKTIGMAFGKNTIGDDSHLSLNSIYNGCSHMRVRNAIEATTQRSKIEVNEVVFGSSDQKFDLSTYVINKGAHSNASLESKAALMDSSYCILKGFAKLEKGAIKAKSYVHERGILLDKSAKVSGLPDMSVEETDVKATHSSATAPIDPESVFYLMSKGIDEIGVKKLLVTGFFANSIVKIKNNFMRELSMSLINKKLETKIYGEVPTLDTRNMWIASDVGDSDMFKGHYKYRGAE